MTTETPHGQPPASWFAELEVLPRRGMLKKERATGKGPQLGSLATFYFDLDDEYLCYYQNESSGAYIPNETLDLCSLEWVGGMVDHPQAFEVAYLEAMGRNVIFLHVAFFIRDGHP